MLTTKKARLKVMGWITYDSESSFATNIYPVDLFKFDRILKM